KNLKVRLNEPCCLGRYDQAVRRRWRACTDLDDTLDGVPNGRLVSTRHFSEFVSPVFYETNLKTASLEFDKRVPEQAGIVPILVWLQKPAVNQRCKGSIH